MYEWYFMYKDIVPEKTRKHEVAFQGTPPPTPQYAAHRSPRTILLPLSLRSLLPQILCIPRHPHQRETIKYDNVIRKKLRQQPELTLFRAKFYFPVFSSVQQRSYSSMASPTSSVHSDLPM